MTNPDTPPQPRDIAMEMPPPGQVEQLEAASEPADGRVEEGTDGAAAAADPTT